MASLSYLYDHHDRTTTLRLLDLQHKHHVLTLASTHVHLEHDLCMETVILRGPGQRRQRSCERHPGRERGEERSGALDGVVHPVKSAHEIWAVGAFISVSHPNKFLSKFEVA